jgi:hypothetical protein
MAKELFACAAIVLSIVLAGGRPASASQPPEIATMIELDTGILGAEVGGRIEAGLVEQLGPALAEAGYVVTSDPATSTATLRVRVITFDADALDYEAEVQLVRAGEEPIRSTTVCNACSENRLVDRIIEDASGLLERKEAALAVEPLEPEQPEPAVEPTPRARRVRAIGPVGVTGVALGTVGIAVASVGVERLLKGVIRRPPDDSGAIRVEDHRPAGAAATTLGAAALITGAVLVAVDVKRRRLENRSYAIHVGRDYLGFQIEHRF